MEFLLVVLKVVVVLQIVLGLASLCTWIERKGSALIQDRIGANRAGAYITVESWWLKPAQLILKPLGILGVINTLMCDATKAIMKEDYVPAGVSQFMHSLGPFMAVLPVFLAYSVVPFAPDFEIGGYVFRSQIAVLDAGVLFILAMGSISVYGVAFAGWTANNKFALLGGLRAAAQMVSYELALGFALAAAIVAYGTLDLYEIVVAQQGWWGVFTQPLTFIIFFVAGMAETKRGPFDLPESESELVAGYFTEYSGMKFLLFWLGEFAEIALLGVLATLLFFGGWDPLPWVLDLPEGPWWAALLGHLIFISKVVAVCVVQIVLRWTLPRFRYDQLMNLGWKILLPVSLVNLLLCAVLKLEGIW